MFDSPKQLAKHLRRSIFPQKSSIILSTPRWRIFWSVLLPPSSYTVWFRAIHRKLPTKKLLHFLLLNLHDSSRCIHCLTQEHFLVLCPKKQDIWVNTLNFFSPNNSFPPQQIINTILQLHCPLWLTRSPTAPSISVGSILFGIWKAHWQTIFDETPFVSSVIVKSCKTLIWQPHHQNT
ncbi:uncharacterized protein BX663DRAFT_442096 [Cokeromyces recurvatus]|uniref:uncharacterized protein n=1 Tax=Cokeromyces recurvatus TaxID=90255 RepID=UPI0022208236|nr:uncharacterized protein BX663DRAFT_442096 [Cokeromyces recurvatus]KAI7898947.1 hypothetical protein BX663DRAFT_442096 [Cokeromyces recurvatus]